MELENIKRNTTWNDASESINSNFSKIRQELLLLGNKEGLTEAELEEFLTSNGYTKEEWVLAQNALLEERIENLEQEGGAVNVEGSEFVNVDEDGTISLDVDPQGGLGRTEQGLGIVDIPSHLLEGIKIDVDSSMSDTSENAVANKVIKKYVDERAEQAYGQANEYTDEEIEHIEGVLNARIDSLEGGKVYNIYYNESNNLSDEQLEANGKAYAALMSEEKAAFYLVQEGNVYSRLIVSTTMKSASVEAIAVEAHVILPIGNKTMLGTTAINLYQDGHISMTVVQSELLDSSTLLQELDKKQDVLVSGTTIKTINGQDILGEGDLVIGGEEEESSQESVYYIALPEDMEEPYLSDEQMEQNRIAFEAYINAFENGEPLPSLIWDANPYPSYKITPYYVDSNQIDFDILVAYFPGPYSQEVEYIGGSLQWDGYVSNYVNAHVTLPTTYAFKTINGESIIGEGDIEIQVDQVVVDSVLSSESSNPVESKAIKAYIDSADDDIKERIDTLEKTVASKSSGYTHEQTEASAQWTIKHDMERFPSVTVADSAGTVVYGDVNYDNANQITITFTAAFSGMAYLN